MLVIHLNAGSTSHLLLQYLFEVKERPFSRIFTGGVDAHADSVAAVRTTWGMLQNYMSRETAHADQSVHTTSATEKEEGFVFYL